MRDVTEAWRDPALGARGLLGHLEDGALGARPLPALSLAHDRSADPSFPAGPRLGEHTDAVLAELG